MGWTIGNLPQTWWAGWAGVGGVNGTSRGAHEGGVGSRADVDGAVGEVDGERDDAVWGRLYRHVHGSPAETASSWAMEPPMRSGRLPVSSVRSQLDPDRVTAARTVVGTRSEPRLVDQQAADLVAGARQIDRRWSSGFHRVGVAQPDEGPQCRAGIAMEVGMHRRPDAERGVEALAIRGEREHEGPPVRVDAPQPDPAHLDAASWCRCDRPRPTRRCRAHRRARRPAAPASRRSSRPHRPAVSAANPGVGPPGRAGGGRRVRPGRHCASRGKHRRDPRGVVCGWRDCPPERRRAGRRAGPTCRSGRAPGRPGRSASGLPATG